MTNSLGWTIAVFILFHAHSFAQFSELKEYGLNGNLQILTTYNYQKIQLVNNLFIPIDSNLWASKEITYFNKKGNVDSVINFFNYENYSNAFAFLSDSTAPKKIRTTKKYYYNQAGVKKTGLEWNSELHSVKTYISIEWIGKNLYIEKRTNGRGIEISSIDSIWLNKNGRDSVGLYSYLLEGELTTLHKFIASYNDKNHLTQSIEQDFLPFSESILTFKIKSMDVQGNPSWINVYMNGREKPELIKVRRYQYYAK